MTTREWQECNDTESGDPEVPAATSAGPPLRMPADSTLSQDAEWCEALVDGEWKRFRFHDYHLIYDVPGLYEKLFYGELGCGSPKVVVSLLSEAMRAREQDPSSLRVLDFGAGNGMVGEVLRAAGASAIVGADILPEARRAALRDRPGLYDDYLVADFTELGSDEVGRLRGHRLNALAVVAALGFGDIPTQAFATAFNAVQDGGWVAFNIRDLFMRSDDESGFASLIRLMTDRGYLQLEMTRRYVHRVNVAGEPLEYIALVGRKFAPLPDRLPRDLQGLQPVSPKLAACQAKVAATPTGSGRARVRLSEVTVAYDKSPTPAVDQVSLDILDGELLVLVGESGSGKSTLLRTINRLVEPTGGAVLIDDRRVEDIDIYEHRRRVGYVIQNVGLLPHLTVAGNVAIVPQLLGWDRSVISRRVDELLRLVGIEPEVYRLRLPAELSGGQQQRVGFARALAARPAILLMDEPFGAVDPITRRGLQQELALLHRQLALTSLLVTHDMAEAMLLGDRIAVMRKGRLVRVGTPGELLTDPGDDYVASLVSMPRDQARRIDALAAAATTVAETD